LAKKNNSTVKSANKTKEPEAKVTVKEVEKAYFSTRPNQILAFPKFRGEKSVHGPSVVFQKGIFKTTDPNVQKLIESHPIFNKTVFPYKATDPEVIRKKLAEGAPQYTEGAHSTLDRKAGIKAEIA
jgi:hypothetical protein